MYNYQRNYPNPCIQVKWAQFLYHHSPPLIMLSEITYALASLLFKTNKILFSEDSLLALITNVLTIKTKVEVRI